LPGPSPTADPTAGTVEDVLDVVRTTLTELIGAENLLGTHIDMDTAFDADLEMDSIEFVALAEQLQERVGVELDFVSWLSGLEFEDIVGLRVGDVVRFVAAATKT
jgi:acyl carrier protein